MSDNSRLISTLSKKWKLEQIPNKKLEMENKLMEERLNSLKAELQNEKQKRNTRGENSIWSKGQVGLVTTYAKNVVNPDSASNKDSILNRPSNRAIKLKILKDEAVVNKQEPSKSSQKDKKLKCGQCEKNLAFTRCLECGEDYCANCFTDFHMKGALQKHRTTSIPLSGKIASPKYPNEQMLSQQMKLQEPSQNSSFGMFDNDDEEFMSGMHEEEEVNMPTSNQYGGSLLQGTYDEKAAGDSFQQALMEWRNPNKDTIKKTPAPQPSNASTKNKVRIKTPMTSRDVIIGTEDSSANKALKELENHINTNQSMSCAERMLLLKLRREQNKENVNGDESYRSGFSTIRQDGETSSSDLTSKNYLIEEIPQKSNFKENKIDPKKLEPELMLLDNREEGTPEISLSYKRPDSILEKKRPTTSRPNTSRPNTARKSTSSSLSFLKLESNICRVSSPTLKKITMREVNVDGLYTEENGIGQFLLLDVEKRKEDSDNLNCSLKSDRPKTGFKLSHKFYEMSPRSWQPSNSIVQNEPVKQVELNTNPSPTKSEISVPSVVHPIKAGPAIKINENVNMTKAKAKQVAENNRPSSVGKISKSMSKNSQAKSPLVSKFDLTKSLARNKTFVSPAELKKTTTPRSQRVASAAGSYARSNPLNVEVAKSFLEFDIDDGRSSRVCQNEEDDDYYGQLEVEYKSNVHRTADFGKIETLVETSRSVQGPKKQNNEYLQELSDNTITGLELSMKDDDYEDDDYLEMDIEELKSLR